jgi:F0F1-type ATP synthase assembly protein I
MSQSVPHLVTAVTAERRIARRVVARQGLVALAAAALLTPWGWAAAAAALAGGAIGVVATSVFAWALFRHPEGTSPARVAWSLYLGQAGKVGLTIGLLATVFRSHVPAPWAVLVGYVATYVAYWSAPSGPANRWTR